MSLKFSTETLLPINLNEINSFSPKTVKPCSFAIMFDNFLRDNVTWELIKSIQKYYPTVKMYIAEQGIFNPTKDLLYKKLTDAGHKIVYTGFDAGLSVCRNKLVEFVKEPYLFYCDSDNKFTTNTKIELFEEILINNMEIGLISCFEHNADIVNHYEINLEYKNNRVLYLDIPIEITNTTNNFFYCDMSMNVGLLRTSIFKDVQWDNRMKLAEHLDFFLSLKYKSAWKVVCAKHVSVENQNFKMNNDIYDSYRNRNVEFWKLYEEKWNVKTINGWIIPQNCPVSIYEGTNVIPQASIIENTVSETNNSSELHNDILMFLKELTDYRVWILNKSCLEIVKHENFITCTLDIGTASDILKNGIRGIYNSTPRPFILNIIVEPDRRIKQLRIVEGVTIYVPCPVIEYLSNI